MFSAALLAAVCYAQAAPQEMRTTAQNLNFAEGIPGSAPPGWFLGPAQTPFYTAAIASRASCFGWGRCAMVRVDAEFSSPASRLAETFIVVKNDGEWKIREHQAVRGR